MECEYEEIRDADADVDEHVRLVAEIPAIQRLPISERLLLARRRRLDQVMRYERWTSYRDAAVTGHRARHTVDGHRVGQRRRSLRFAGAVSLLEAVRAGNVDEGSSTFSRLNVINKTFFKTKIY